MGELHTDDGDLISSIIAEFSDVFAFSRKGWTRFAEELSPELSAVGMIVLHFVIRKGPVTATGISQTLDMDKSIVSRQIAKLRDLTLIDTVETPEDRRVQLITGTEKGTKVIDHIRGLWANAYREQFAGWSDDELGALHTGLHKFNTTATDARQANGTGTITTVSE